MLTLLLAALLAAPAFAGDPPELQALEARVLPEVQQRDADAAARLAQLKQRDLRAYAQQLHKLNERLRIETEHPEVLQTEAEMKAVEAQLQARALAWQQADPDRERKKIRGEIEDLAQELFDLRQQMHTHQIGIMGERLAELEAELADREANRQALIDEWLSERLGE